MCGVAGGGWWYADSHGLITEFLDDLNGRAEPIVVAPPEPTPEEIEAKKAKEAKENQPEEDPTKARGYVWGLADGMWEPPTHGDPLDLKYIAPGLKALVAIRPADIAKHPEGEKLLDPKVSGVLGTWVRQQLPAISGTGVDNIELVLIGVLKSPLGPPRLSLVLHFFQPIDAEAMKKVWPDAEEERMGERAFFHKGEDAYFLPASAEGKILVVAPATEMRDIVSCDGTSLLIPLQLEKMLQTSTDRERMLTLVTTGDMLATAGQGLLLGPAAAIKDIFDWLLSTSDSADPTVEMIPAELPKVVLFSCHLSEDFFAELRYSNLEAGPDSTLPAEAIRQRLGLVPKKINRAIIELHPSDYSTKVLTEFPDQVDALEKFTRVGVVDRQVVLRSYLPAAAAPNLMLATYLCLLENYSGPAAVGGGAVAVVQNAAPASAAEALKKKITLSFPRNTLEVAMQMMADEIKTPIKIIGPDLQIDGITKNQSFGLEEKDVPAIEILYKILKQANPDGKLIYVIKTVDGKEEIWLTTRQAAEKRKDTLTPDMVQQAADKKKK